MLVATPNDPRKLEPRYLSPAAPAAGFSLRVIAVPDAPEFHSAITDALKILTKVTNWTESTAYSNQESAWIMREMLNTFLSSSLTGVIVPVLTETLPDNMLWCDGSTYAKALHPQLWQALPEGMKTETDFTLPDLRNRFIYGADNDVFDVGVTGGAQTVTLTESEIPSHIHTSQPHAHAVTASVGVGAAVIGPEPVALPSVPTSTGLSGVIIDPTGGGQAHNNMPPFYCVRYAIFAG